MENAKTRAKPLAKTEDYLMLCLLVICCLAVPRAYVTPHTSLLSALTYHFTHANAWHVALNFLFLLRYKPRWKSALSGWLCASVAALSPLAACTMPTCGLTGMCYAMIARSDVWYGRPNWVLLLSNVPLALWGGFNWKIHLLSYTLSYILWAILHRRK